MKLSSSASTLLLTLFGSEGVLVKAVDSHENRYYYVKDFTVDELQSGRSDQQLKSVLSTTGLLAIRLKGPTSTSIIEQHLLSPFCSCFQSMNDGTSRAFEQEDLIDIDTTAVKVHLLDDGQTTRHTIATATYGFDRRHDLPSNQKINQFCDKNSNDQYDLHKIMETSRDVVSYAINDAFIPALDRLLSTSAAPDNSNRRDLIKTKLYQNIHDNSSTVHKKQYNSISSIVQDSLNLEHFHVYNKEQGHVNEQQDSHIIDTALDWHEDAGLFLAFLPGFSCNLELNDNKDEDDKDDGALHILVPDQGDHVAVFPKTNNNGNGDIIVGVMLGIGAQDWLQQDDLKLSATTHSVKMKNGDKRVWYGKMHLVPSDTIIDQYSMEHTFKDMQTMIATNNDDHISIGCGVTTTSSNSYQPHQALQLLPSEIQSYDRRRRLHGVTSQKECEAKGSDQFFCWLSCLNIDTSTKDGEGKSLYCHDKDVFESTGNLEEAVKACTNTTTDVVGAVANMKCGLYFRDTVSGVPFYTYGDDNHDGNSGDDKDDGNNAFRTSIFHFGFVVTIGYFLCEIFYH